MRVVLDAGMNKHAEIHLHFYSQVTKTQTDKTGITDVTDFLIDLLQGKVT